MSSSDVNHLSQPCIYGHFLSSDGERKSRFMKWLSKIFKSGSDREVTGRHYPQYIGEENMVRRAPARSLDDRSRTEKEREELDRAIALSLAEDLKRPPGYRWRTDNNEDLRALQDSLHSNYPPYAPTDYYRSGYRLPSFSLFVRVRKCFTMLPNLFVTILSGTADNEDLDYAVDANVTLDVETIWDAWELFSIQSASAVVLVVSPSLSMRPNGFCFCCFKFSLSGKDAYHKSCFKELTHPKSLGDGRSLCLECMESAIMDTGDCQPLYHAIRDYYEGMYMKLDQQIPMLLVERQALNEAIVGEKNGFHHMPETRGLCLSEEQTVTSILKRPKVGGPGHRLIGMRTQPQKLTRKCEVTAILVLYGLPRLLTGAILAHELMHGWLRLKGYRNLNPEVEEGICQVLSYMWLESEVMPGLKNMPSSSAASSSSSVSSSKKGGKSGVENKLGEFFMHQIAHDASPAYGGGFRAANAAVHRLSDREWELSRIFMAFHLSLKLNGLLSPFQSF
ncbi:hypothetical protein C3L33_02838, partial [Rhododendron williamsianum]